MAMSSEPVRRAAEIEEASNLYFIHPLSAWIVPYCARAGITPNQLSFTGMGCGIAAGVAYHFYPHLWCVGLGFALMLAWHVLDGADGQLARLTNNFSPIGKVIDGICDYVTFAAVFIGFALALARLHGGWVWGVAVAAGLCQAVQAAAYELQRQYYNVYGLGRNSAALPDLDAPAPPGAAAWLHRVYTRLQLLVAGGAAQFHARFGAALQARPDEAEALRARYCDAFAPAVKRWSLLSSNTRTIAIFLSALVGAPILYFLFVIFALTGSMFWLLAAQRKHYADFALSL